MTNVASAIRAAQRAIAPTSCESTVTARMVSVLGTPYNQSSHATAKTVPVDEYASNASDARGIRYIIEIALWIRNFLVDGRRNYLVWDGEARCCCLQDAGHGDWLAHH